MIEHHTMMISSIYSSSFSSSLVSIIRTSQLIVVVIVLLTTTVDGRFINNRPIIGVLAQETEFIHPLVGAQYHSYIVGSYVQFVEGSGGRVVPIWIGREEAYYRDIVEHTNGLLFPGGAVEFNVSGGFAEAGQYLYKYAKLKNDNGVHYPILGICLGMELLPFLSLNEVDIREDCNAENVSLPMTFDVDYKYTKLFRHLPGDLARKVHREPLTSNFHHYCYTVQNFRKHNVTDWLLIAQSADIDGMKFVAAMESYTYPFYGLQFHPEKNIYEYVRLRDIDHSRDAIEMSQYLANFFIEETRLNAMKYPTFAEEDAALIYNYDPIYVGHIYNSAFEQVYAFTKEQSGF